MIKDFFLQLLAIITLYLSAINFTVLIFQYINILIPDPIVGSQGFYTIESSYDRIRWSIASLIVIFPLYVWLTWFLNKGYFKDPQKREARIRKWLIYFTLFVASLIIVGDLVTLIFRFLGGELTLRFVLKVLAILFVTGSIFSYYLWEIKKYSEEQL